MKKLSDLKISFYHKIEEKLRKKRSKLNQVFIGLRAVTTASRGRRAAATAETTP